MIQRELTAKLLQLSKKFPIISVIGARQTGKTTLVKSVFPDYKYISLEDLDIREFALNDPRGFLKTYKNKIILDEIQRSPGIFSYLQTHVDSSKEVGQFILTGSQNFLLMEKISQSLSGRVGILKLMPLSLKELSDYGKNYTEYEEYIFNGMYPAIYDREISPFDWYQNYIQTYVERDVRLIKNIMDINGFQRFIKICASRIGQVLNLLSIGNECGITHNTAKAWISILESSFIIFLLKPHYNNYGKRLIKMPKIYFYDAGLVCYLLGISDMNHLSTHYLKGNIFESFIISEIMKSKYNSGIEPNCYFWRDKTGHEIDCLIESGNKIKPVEIKSGMTLIKDYFNNINYWNKLSGNKAENSYLIYGGIENQIHSNGNVISWKNIRNIL